MASQDSSSLTENAAGRFVPEEVNGRPAIPYKGVAAHSPRGGRAAPPIRSCAQYPADGDKRAPSLAEAFRRAGLRDGMTVSSHHHYRDGDLLPERVFQTASDMGIRDLVWFPSGVFPCHKSLLAYLESGVIRRIESGPSGPLGDFASHGGMDGLTVVRSHGGRYQALQDGDVHVDLAVIASSAADAFGNCSGAIGPNACGSLGNAVGDSQYADHVIAVTDHLVEFPCIPWQIQGNAVDQIVVVDQVGDASRIVSGTTEITRDPQKLLIAENAARFLREAGIMRPGFSFQAGAGGISLAFTAFLGEMMREAGVKARFIRGGATKHLVRILEEGLTDYILDGQCFDLEAVRSLRENPRHIATTPYMSYNYHGKGNIASLLDCVVLGATEIDVNFNANCVTHSDGRLLHNLGGWQDSLFSRCTILTVPTHRKKAPVIRESVTTLCGPGELIDVVITEKGAAVNPRREDLIAALSGSALPLRTLGELREDALSACGGEPDPPKLADELFGVVNWVDGTVIDSLRVVDR